MLRESENSQEAPHLGEINAAVNVWGTQGFERGNYEMGHDFFSNSHYHPRWGYLGDLIKQQKL